MVEKTIKRALEVACINIPVSNVERSCQWYTAHLGCKVLRQPQKFSDGNANALIKFGESGPAVWLRESPGQLKFNFSRMNGDDLTLFELRTENINEFYEQLRQEGVNVFGRLDVSGCGSYFKVSDPDGNMYTILEF